MIVGVSMVRDEGDIIARIIAHLLDEGLDHLIIADNLSTDGTRQLLADWHDAFPYRLTVVDDPEIGYYQDRKTSNLAHQAGAMGATWILPFDADEYWYAKNGTIKDALERSEADVMWAGTLQHVPQLTDSDEPDPVRRMEWRSTQPKGLVKVAFRYHPEARLHMGNHDVDLPRKITEGGQLEIREFQYRTFSQMKRKVRNGKQAYDATNLNETYGAHWRRMGAMSDSELRAEWDSICATEGLIRDPVHRRLHGRAA